MEGLTLIIGAIAFAIGWSAMAAYDGIKTTWQERKRKYPNGNWDSYIP